MDQYKIKHKVTVLSSLFILASSFLAFATALFFLQQSFKEHRKDVEYIFKKETKEYLLENVSLAYQLIDYYAKRLPEKEAKEKVSLLLSELKYSNQNGYFVVYEKKGEELSFASHGLFPQWKGEKADLSIHTNDGVYYRKDFIEKAYSGGGFTLYSFQKPNTQVVIPKLGYSLLYAPWNWIIVGGIYVDDIDQKMLEVVQGNDDKEFNFMLSMVVISLIILLLSVGLTYHFVGRDIEHILKAILQELGKQISAIKRGELSYRGDPKNIHFEFQNIVTDINQMIDYAMAPILEAKVVLEKMGEADLRTTMQGDYLGDHRILKDALNKTIDSMNEILLEVTVLTLKVSDRAKMLTQTTEEISRKTLMEEKFIKDLLVSLKEFQVQLENKEQMGTLWEKLSDILKIVEQVDKERQNSFSTLAQYVELADELNDEATYLSAKTKEFKLTLP